MSTYKDAIDDLRRNLLPPNVSLFWHDGETEKKVGQILVDLELLEQNKPELALESQQRKLAELHDIIKKIYDDFRHGRPEQGMSSDNLNEYITTVADWFEQRYKLVQGNQFLKKMYSKYGCDALFGKLIKVEGKADASWDGPAVIMCSGHMFIEFILVQAISPRFMYWVSDFGFWLTRKKYVRVAERVPLVKRIVESAGLILVNRGSQRGLAAMVHKCVHALEQNQLVAIFPEGSSDFAPGKFQMTNTGGIYIAQKAEESLKRKIPIIPIGVRYERGAFIVAVGEKIFLPDDASFDRKQFAAKVLEAVERLYAPNGNGPPDPGFPG